MLRGAFGLEKSAYCMICLSITPEAGRLADRRTIRSQRKTRRYRTAYSENRIRLLCPESARRKTEQRDICR